MPPEMERQDEVGAVAAAEYFMALHEWTYATGDTSRWDEISGQTCGFCSNVHSDVADAYSQGGRVRNGGSSFTGFALAGFDEQLMVYSVSLHFDVAETARLNASHEVTGTIAAESGDLVLDVAPSVRGWVLIAGDAK